MIKCLAEGCGKEDKIISYRHLKSHNLTTTEYLKKYPGSILSDESYTKLMSESCSKVPRTPEWNAKNSASQKGKIMSEESCEKMSEAAKIRIERDGNPMDRPEVRAKLFATQGTDLYKENHRRATQSAEYRAKQSEIRTNFLRDPKNYELFKAIWSDPVRNQKISDHNSMKNPQMRQEHLDLMQSQENRDRASKHASESWQDPDYRERLLEIMQDRWEDFYFRQKHSASLVKGFLEGRVKPPLISATKGGYYPGTKIYMRSTWERNFARILDHLKLKWQYEPRGFMLSNLHAYLPDFYLPQLDLWVEVKGYKTDEFIIKWPLFLEEVSGSKWLADEVQYKQLSAHYQPLLPTWEI
jgi:hypothetical protein